jgi:2-polyprenyl-3-methyl-5-hydroxy-6-metoxy-1,4-benzoquinol methylase
MPLSSALPPCPITGRPARRRVHGVSTRALLAMWRAAGAGDLSRLFPEAPQVVLYESDTGLYFFTPMLAGDADFYRRFYATHAAHATLSAHSEARREFVYAARHIAAGSRVLDVGCGSGAFREHLPQCTYRGLDPYAEAGAAGDVIRQSLPEHVEEARGRYDVVTAFQVIEHVADPLGFARQLLSLLRPGGTLIVCAPLHPSPLTEIPNFLINAPPHHLSWWTASACQALAEAIGVEAVEIVEIPASSHDSEAIVHWMHRFSLLRARPGLDERYFAHRWGWHLNLVVSYLLARLAMPLLPSPKGGRPCSVMLVARSLLA